MCESFAPSSFRLFAGGTFDHNVSEIVSLAPLQLREVLPADGGAYGGTAVDAAFLAFLEQLTGVRTADMPTLARLAITSEWYEKKVGARP